MSLMMFVAMVIYVVFFEPEGNLLYKTVLVAVCTAIYPLTGLYYSYKWSREPVEQAPPKKVLKEDQYKEKLEQQIEEWKTKWQQLQILINQKIKERDFNGAYRTQCEATTLKRCIKDAYAILEPKKFML